jgi:hypothetical protein
MARYGGRLPQLFGTSLSTDGGIKTTLIFHDGLELPDFAAFHLLRTAEGEARAGLGSGKTVRPARFFLAPIAA